MFFRSLSLAALAVVVTATNTAYTQLAIGLAPRDSDILARTVHALSDPTSPRYGKYLSREAAALLVQPHPDDVSAVQDWLREAGVQDKDVRHEGQLIQVRMSTETASSLLRRDDAAQSVDVVPESLRQVVRAVYRSESTQTSVQDMPFHAPHHTEYASPNGGEDTSDCDAKLTPPCIREKYDMKNIPATTRTVLGVVGFDEQAAQYAQLDAFLHAFDPANVLANFSEASLNGGANPQGSYPGGEANLDIQYAVALAAANVDVRFYSVGGKNYNFIPDLDGSLPQNDSLATEPYLELASSLALLPTSALPSVLSISYGVNEQLLPRPYAAHVCDLFGQLALRGVSILASSGDAGPGQSCQSNDGSKRTRFLPAFPASCPYVTAVGATQGAKVDEEETALGLSGGGFSEYFDRPRWQEGDVGEYVRRHGGRWKRLFNEQGRGMPDVAALGVNYQIYNHDEVESADGTSASTPVVAAMVAVLNSLRAQKGKPTMGFLNPWLYKFGRHGLTDIVKGKSSGCPGYSYAGLPSPMVPGAGWDADRGWDAATGLGSPVFSRLRRLACL